MTQESTNYHADYPDIRRYWSETSQHYAGGDHLLTAFQRDWQIPDTVYEEVHWLGGSRPIKVYYFELSCGDARMTMPVISNPFVRRMIRYMKLKVLPIAERPAVRERRADR
jgi:hypothetical protein